MQASTTTLPIALEMGPATIEQRLLHNLNVLFPGEAHENAAVMAQIRPTLHQKLNARAVRRYRDLFVQDLQQLAHALTGGSSSLPRESNPLGPALQSLYHTAQVLPEAWRRTKTLGNKAVVEATVPLVYSHPAVSTAYEGIQDYYASPTGQTWVYTGGAAGPSMLSAPLAMGQELAGVGGQVAAPVASSLRNVANTGALFAGMDAGMNLAPSAAAKVREHWEGWKHSRRARKAQSLRS